MKATTQHLTDAIQNDDANELVRCMSEGNQAALFAFSRAYRRFALSVIYKFIRDRQEAEEIFHDALLKLYRNSDKFDPDRGSALVYFKTVLRRTALDRLKRKRVLLYVENPFDLAPRESRYIEADSPADTAETNFTRERLKQAISELSPALRAPLEVLCSTGDSYGEVAQALQIPLGTAKASIRRGIRALREAMESERSEGSRWTA